MGGWVGGLWLGGWVSSAPPPQHTAPTLFLPHPHPPTPPPHPPPPPPPPPWPSRSVYVAGAQQSVTVDLSGITNLYVIPASNATTITGL